MACGQANQAAIDELLDTRDASISARDISAYSQLISDDYREDHRSKADIVAQMVQMFDRFEGVHMQSFNREVRLLDEGRAECQQSYRLKVQSGSRWRQMVQRERITLRRTDTGWQIVAGL